MLSKQLFIILISCGLLACAGTENRAEDGAAEEGGRRSHCIFRSSVRGYTVLDDANLIVKSGARRKYHLTLQRRAFGLRSSWNIGFKSSTSNICAGFSEVVFLGEFDNESIRIASIQELSPEQHEDLLIRFGKLKPETETPPVPVETEGAEVEELDPDANGD